MTSTPSNLAPPRILVIDDEPQIHRFLSPALTASGYEPLRAENAMAGLNLAATHAPSAVLLDLGLPDLDGQEVIPRLRAFTAAPIIVLSARDGEAAKVAALDGGADDFVQKPFALAELLARLRASLRRAAAAAGQDAPAVQIRLGELEIDLAARAARLGGTPLKLTPREWGLLAALARAGAGRVVTQRQLLSAVWGPGHAESSQYLRVYIGHLRQKLGEAATLIRTEPGVGYRLGPPD
ncbi:two-component system, OmpR family, KDP operon response regulator KdpE [Roseomonas rosea]|uniref:Two-component system, OmpR family, KDP operon response regulator KdpE n=1 Tax=Muricoccus roseus TaxID=198092 RepID=A0A1M6HPJ9_9PROT|nr:response regulator [Roseomonas rosea]SHJ24043.1 two-component system, OmpR family, KDP operon response regulator KdpE [Roseomonas rosea]